MKRWATRLERTSATRSAAIKHDIGNLTAQQLGMLERAHDRINKALEDALVQRFDSQFATINDRLDGNEEQLQSIGKKLVQLETFLKDKLSLRNDEPAHTQVVSSDPPADSSHADVMQTVISSHALAFTSTDRR